MVSKLDVIARNGVPFRVVRLPGDTPSENQPAEFNDYARGKVRVEFYDRRYNHTPDGQFTGASYFRDDLTNDGYGLNLAGGVPDWSVDRDTMRLIHEWLDNNAQ